MTENEIIDFVENEINVLTLQRDGAFGSVASYSFKKQKGEKKIETFRTIIGLITWLKQYQAIGTVKECREAVERQKPKKIIIESYCSTECPTCGHELSTSLGDGYYKYPTFLERCPNCGQVIQWEENLEGMEDE